MSNIAMYVGFLDAFRRLPHQQQRRVGPLIALFNRDPTARSLNYEPIKGAKDPMYSLRIDGSYRAIVLKPRKGNVHILLWADKHDDAYDWARRRRCHVHPVSGAVQVYLPSPSPPPSSSPGPRSRPRSARRHHGAGVGLVSLHTLAGYAPTPPIRPTTSPPLDDGPGEVAPAPAEPTGAFADLKDRELMRLGVPQAMLLEVRGSPGYELANLVARLPAEAGFALALYIRGEPYEDLVRERETPQTVDMEDFAAALQRPESQMRFAVAADEMELEAMLNAPLAAQAFRQRAQYVLAWLLDRPLHWGDLRRVLGGAQIAHFDTRKEHDAHLVECIGKLRENDEPLRGACVAARTSAERNAAAKALQHAGFECIVLGSSATDDEQRSDAVRVATMHLVRGLEFDHVLLASVNSGLMPLRARGEAEGWLLLAAAGARKSLTVLSFGRQSRFLRPPLQSPQQPQSPLHEHAQPASSAAALDLDALIAAGESEQVEFKSTLRINLHTKAKDEKMRLAVIKTIAGFLNTRGGTLIVGVGDDGAPIGIENDGFANEDKMNLHLTGLVNDKIGKQAWSSISTSFRDYQGFRVLVVRCEKSARPVYVKEERETFYIRTGNATNALSVKEGHEYISSGRFSASV